MTTALDDLAAKLAVKNEPDGAGFHCVTCWRVPCTERSGSRCSYTLVIDEHLYEDDAYVRTKTIEFRSISSSELRSLKSDVRFNVTARDITLADQG